MICGPCLGDSLLWYPSPGLLTIWPQDTPYLVSSLPRNSSNVCHTLRQEFRNDAVVLILDCRRILQGFQWRLLPNQFVEEQQLIDSFSPACPPGYYVAIRGGTPCEGFANATLRVIGGQLLEVVFAVQACSPPGASDMSGPGGPPPLALQTMRDLTSAPAQAFDPPIRAQVLASVAGTAVAGPPRVTGPGLFWAWRLYAQ